MASSEPMGPGPAVTDEPGVGRPVDWTMAVGKRVLQIVFDTAVHSMDFGSGFLDDEEVLALREVAVILGVDPIVATPDNFKCKYLGHELLDLTSERAKNYVAAYLEEVRHRCQRCRATVEPAR